jgi:hypothetical protein
LGKETTVVEHAFGVKVAMSASDRWCGTGIAATATIPCRGLSSKLAAPEEVVSLNLPIADRIHALLRLGLAKVVSR